MKTHYIIDYEAEAHETLEEAEKEAKKLVASELYPQMLVYKLVSVVSACRIIAKVDKVSS